MSAADDVVVTGLGATTPLGGDVPTFWSGLLEGRSGIVALTEEWAADLSVRIAGRMAVDPAEQLPRVQARRLDRSEQAALIAAREAWADAGFQGKSAEAGLDPTRVAVVIGTGIGGVTSLVGQYDIYLAKGPGRVSPPAGRVGEFLRFPILPGSGGGRGERLARPGLPGRGVPRGWVRLVSGQDLGGAAPRQPGRDGRGAAQRHLLPGPRLLTEKSPALILPVPVC